MIYFTSDTHFNHTNICGPTVSKWSGGYRDFDCIEQMNDLLIDNINSVVGPNDTLYHLGDFAFGDRAKIPALRERINCNFIYLIKGNHDHNIEKYSNCFELIKTYYEFFSFKTLITMMHYPIASWNGLGRGAYNLHGHTHFTFLGNGKQLDVGVDNLYNKYLPWSLDDVNSYMSKAKVQIVDHHNENTNIK